jgi:hypothetical protein
LRKQLLLLDSKACIRAIGEDGFEFMTN